METTQFEESRSFVESIYDRNREYYSDRRGMGALKDLQQTFPNPWLYIAELLQNAVDEDATRVSVASPPETGPILGGQVSSLRKPQCFGTPFRGQLTAAPLKHAGPRRIGAKFRRKMRHY